MTDSRIIFCGSRDWRDPSPILSSMIGQMDALRLAGRRMVVVHGGARGADQLAGQVASSLGVTTEEHRADWNGRGRMAGHERNRLMLNLGAEAVYAFKRGFNWAMDRGGTENMVKIAKEAGVNCAVYDGFMWHIVSSSTVPHDTVVAS